jgi:hypothetical protein
MDGFMSGRRAGSGRKDTPILLSLHYDSLFIMLRASEPPLRRKAIVKMPSKSDAARLTARVM